MDVATYLALTIEELLKDLKVKDVWRSGNEVYYTDKGIKYVIRPEACSD